MSGYRDYPLSFVQESLWVAEQYAETSPYVENWTQRLRGHLDIGALTRALAQFQARHPALRSRFLTVGRSLVQRVHHAAGLALDVADWHGRDPAEALASAARRPMDLRDGAFRAVLVRLAPDDHILFVQCHHIIIDDHSFDLLSAELQELYAAAVRGGHADLPAAGISPGEYAAGQRARGISEASLRWWTRYLDGAGPLPALPPTGRPPAGRPLLPRPGNQPGRVTAEVDAGVTARVRQCARAARTTPTVVLLSAFAMTLAAAAGTTDVIIGQAVSHRGPACLDRVVGCFTDTLPLRLRIPPDAAFSDVCRSARRDVICALGHRDVPWAAIAKSLTPAPGMLPGEGLIRVVMVVEEPARLALPGLDCERVYVAPAGVKFDWSLSVVAQAGRYHCYVDYAADLFTTAEAALALRQWTRALAAACGAPDATVAALSRAALAARRA